MPATPYVPHVDVLLKAMRIGRERLNSNSKIAIDSQLLRMLLQLIVEGQPFSSKFYLETYPDIKEANAKGGIPNLRRHMVEQGYLEGRLGSQPQVNEAFYLALYPDVGDAIQRGEIANATEHYIRAGSAEGRTPTLALQPIVNHWNQLLRDYNDVSAVR